MSAKVNCNYCRVLLLVGELLHKIGNSVFEFIKRGILYNRMDVKVERRQCRMQGLYADKEGQKDR